MALPDLTGQNIQDTYKRVLTVHSDGNMYDGTGSLFIPPSASVEITHEVSSSYAETASAAYNFNAGNDITANRFLGSFHSPNGGVMLQNGSNIAVIVGSDSDTLKLDGTSLNLSSGPISTGDTFTSTNYISVAAITASGDISSSGDITAGGNIYLDYSKGIFGKDQDGNVETIVTSAPDTIILFADADSKTQMNGNGMVLDSGKDIELNAAGGYVTMSDGTNDSITFDLSTTSPAIFFKTGSTNNHKAEIISYEPSVNGLVWGNINNNSYYQSDGFHQYLSGRIVMGGSDPTPSAKLSVVGDIAATNITASGDISASVLKGENLLLGDIHPGSINKDLHIKNVSSVGVRLESTGNNNQTIEFYNNQEPDFTIGNYFSQAGLQIRSDNKTFVTVGANQGDVINFSGSVSASGNVSASGYVTFGTPGEKQIHTFYGKIKTVGSEVVIGDGHVTASGNISASGDINAGSLGTGSFDHIITSGQTIEFKDGASKLATIQADSAGSLTFGNESSGRSAIKVSDVGATSGNHEIRLLSGAITASGEISASGGIYANDYYSKGQAVLNYSSGNDRITIGNKPTLIQGNLTASRDISGSGVITGATGSFHKLRGDTTQATGLVVSGYIEASGNITASGHISASSLETSGNITAVEGHFTGAITSSGMIDNFAGTATGSVHKPGTQGWDGKLSGTTRLDSLIFLTPADFTFSDNISVRYYGLTAETGGASDGEFGVALNGIVSYFAQWVIPKGYKVTGGKVFASAGNYEAIRSFVWDSTGTVLQSSTACATALSGTITETNIGTANIDNWTNTGGGPGQYISIKWDPANTSDRLYGAIIMVELC